MLPKDPVMLLSFVNTQLRDNYNSLEDFCKSFDVEKCDIEKSLILINYFYDSKLNQFK